jgi:ankyrin repeat protein
VRLGADVTLRDADGWSPLFCAVQLGYVDVVRELVIFGADVDTQDGLGRSTTYFAVQQVQLRVLFELSRVGADIDRSDLLSRSPLTVASNFNFFDFVLALWALGAKPAVWHLQP